MFEVVEFDRHQDALFKSIRCEICQRASRLVTPNIVWSRNVLHLRVYGLRYVTPGVVVSAQMQYCYCISRVRATYAHRFRLLDRIIQIRHLTITIALLLQCYCHRVTFALYKNIWSMFSSLSTSPLSYAAKYTFVAILRPLYIYTVWRKRERVNRICRMLKHRYRVIHAIIIFVFIFYSK